jgi:hypothetical protein
MLDDGGGIKALYLFRRRQHLLEYETRTEGDRMTRSRIAVSSNPRAFKTRYRDCPSPLPNGVGGTKNCKTTAGGMRPGASPDPQERYTPSPFLWVLMGTLVLVSMLLGTIR